MRFGLVVMDPLAEKALFTTAMNHIVTKLVAFQVLRINPNETEAILVSNTSFLDKYTVGAINRDVNMPWVNKLCSDAFPRMIRDGTFTEVVACINRSDIFNVYENELNETEFKAMVVDGQHRMEAMRKLVQNGTITAARPFEFIVRLLIIENEKDLAQRLLDLNNRLNFSLQDEKVVETRVDFINCFIQFITNRFGYPVTRRHVVQNVQRSDILREPEVLKKITACNTTSILYQKFERLMLDAEYKKQYLTRVATGQISHNHAIAKVINETKMFFLADTTCRWIYKLLDM